MIQETSFKRNRGLPLVPKDQPKDKKTKPRKGMINSPEMTTTSQFSDEDISSPKRKDGLLGGSNKRKPFIPLNELSGSWDPLSISTPALMAYAADQNNWGRVNDSVAVVIMKRAVSALAEKSLRLFEPSCKRCFSVNNDHKTNQCQLASVCTQCQGTGHRAGKCTALPCPNCKEGGHGYLDCKLVFCQKCKVTHERRNCPKFVPKIKKGTLPNKGFNYRRPNNNKMNYEEKDVNPNRRGKPQYRGPSRPKGYRYERNDY